MPHFDDQIRGDRLAEEMEKHPEQITNLANLTVVELRLLLSSCIGQFKFAQHMLETGVKGRSPQLDIFIQMLEQRLKVLQ